MKQLIFVVETTPKNQSDDRYIDKLISKRYDLSSNEIKKRYVHMEGKTKYKSRAVTTLINKMIKENDGENIVIYCFDTDRIDVNVDCMKCFEEARSYCKNQNYLLVWFNYNIEFVLLGHNVDSSMKKKESIKYHDNKKININEEKLFSSNFTNIGYSNIYKVLDELLPQLK